MYYVIKRNDDYQIIFVSCWEGQNPLYGYGSWDLSGGPYATWKEAENAWREIIAEEK